MPYAKLLYICATKHKHDHLYIFQMCVLKYSRFHTYDIDPLHLI